MVSTLVNIVWTGWTEAGGITGGGGRLATNNSTETSGETWGNDSWKPDMHGTFMVLLPVSMIIMVVGGVMGFIGLLARAYILLLMTGILLLLGALSSLTGVSVYMAYSAAVFQEAQCLAEQMGVNMEGIQILFGWSLILAWVSSGTQLFTSAGFLLACRTVTIQRQELKL
ncbi:hypothetical protein J4Q44_G00182080 [Coregonus suidteri]|uniref:Transmembrane protein 114 n=1 Tax=Coregonus suidteri TaxID=861788 RepID=A0AAN8QQQ7_9TELE